MRKKIGLAATGLVLAVATTQAQTKLTYGILADPAMIAATWAISAGKVKSDKVTVEVKPLPLPALIQAVATKQYDITVTAVPPVPIALARGIQIKILSSTVRLRSEGVSGDLWVKADSPIKSARDLKGKTIGVYGIQSTGIQLTRFVLGKKYGLNAALEGGDVKLAELPAPTIPGAVVAGRIDAGAFLHFQAWTASTGTELRNIGAGQADINEAVGAPTVTGVSIAYTEKLAANPDAYKEFNRLLKASVDYMLANKAQVYGAVAADTKAPLAYFETYFEKFAEFPQIVSDSDMKAIQRVWEISKEMKLYDKHPDAKDVVWEHALRN